MSDNPEALPELPEPAGRVFHDGDEYGDSWVSTSDAYTADQMRAYARAALAQQAATPTPLFASSVARRKWESLQADGHRMQRLYFERADGRSGTIDAWGVVMWDDAAARQAATPTGDLTVPPKLTDAQIDEAFEEATAALKRHQHSGPRGQQVSPADSFYYWFAGAVENARDAQWTAAARQAATPAPAEPVAYAMPEPWGALTLQSGGQLTLYTRDQLCAAMQQTAPPATPAAQPADGWIAVADRLPEPGRVVLVFSGRTVLRAAHAPRFTLNCDEWGDHEPDGGEYDEATDACYWPEGWYEWNQYEETHWQIGETPTHWRPLPAAPSEGSQG